jgi:FecR protein
MMKHLTSWAALSVLTLGLIPARVLGQAPPPPSDSSVQQDDPYNGAGGGTVDNSSDQQQPEEQAGPGVARVSFLNGDVSSQRGDNGDWVAVTLNSPISQGDRVATGANGRAELQLDSTNILRMSSSATANVTNLSRSNIQVQIGQGLVTYDVRNGAEAVVEIDTPNASIRPSRPGQYRVQVNSDSETVITMVQGSADISTPDGSTHVEQGQMITIEGTDHPQYKTESASNRDDWDSWNSDRDREIGGASSWSKTNRYYTGSEDLDTYGTWSEVPDYGQVWTPNSGDPNWAPYRAGRWVYQPYYGWTWVSTEPWGWAPYHYGRWFVYGGRWAWWPGPVASYPGYYPVWSPAYVSFFGFGAGFGIGFGFGFGFGHVGWLPCGPGDWYHPWFGRYGGHYNSVSVTNINNYHQGYAPLAGSGFHGHAYSNFNEAGRNDRVRSGISSMNSNEFGRGAVSQHQERMSGDSFRNASMVTGHMPISPSHESFSPTGRSANPSSIRSAGNSSQHFFSGGSRNSSVSGARSFGGANNSNHGASDFGGNRGGAGSSASVQSNRSGWQHFTPPQSGASNRSSQGSGQYDRGTANNSSRGSVQGNQAENRNSWQHFTPSTSASRGESSHSYNSYSRPSLNMRQPIVTPRGGSNTYNSRASGSNPYNSNRYGSNPYGNSNAPHGSYNAPRGGYNAPHSTYSAPHPTYTAPHPNYSAPHGGGNNGGGHSSGGGGGHSGGGHSGGHH